MPTAVTTSDTSAPRGISGNRNRPCASVVVPKIRSRGDPEKIVLSAWSRIGSLPEIGNSMSRLGTVPGGADLTG